MSATELSSEKTQSITLSKAQARLLARVARKIHATSLNDAILLLEMSCQIMPEEAVIKTLSEYKQLKDKFEQLKNS